MPISIGPSTSAIRRMPVSRRSSAAQAVLRADRCVVEDEAQLGPFCHLRPDAVIGSRARIGNFVEVKKSRIGGGSRAPHLSYIGVAKHETRIGDRVFVGSHTTLVAPLTVGDGAYVAAGSTITRDVPSGALALGRAPQVDKPGWAERKARERAARSPDQTPGKD